MTLLVRDEIDIIRPVIEYHLNNGVDEIIITDNGSIDGTLEVCREYLNKGVSEVIIEPSSDYSQYLYVSRMANLASSKYKADWIINADADEFFISRTKGDLKKSLSLISDSVDIVEVQRHDFVPIYRDFRNFEPLNFPYRKVFSNNLRGTPLPPKVIHRRSNNITVAMGNHSVSGDNLSNTTTDSDIEIFHYPIRSLKQFESKVTNAGSGLAKNKHLNKNMGFHVRYWYELLLNNKLEEEYNKHFYDIIKLELGLENKEIVKDECLLNKHPFSKN